MSEHNDNENSQLGKIDRERTEICNEESPTRLPRVNY